MSNVSGTENESALATKRKLSTDRKRQVGALAEDVQPLQASSLRLGMWVQVKSASEIKDTLDIYGATDELPLMPEMLEHCGKRFQLAKFANTVCADVGGVEMRSLKNAVVLKMNRCDGCFHGDCQMACELLWKLDWLKITTPPEDASVSVTSGGSSSEHLQTKLIQLSAGTGDVAKAKSSGRFFRCQATELGAATRRSSPLHFAQYRDEHKTNGTSWGLIFRFFANLLVTKALRSSHVASGPCKRTPVTVLNLQPGERVRVKSMQQILQTLDAQGCNRGLWFDPAEMKPFCDQTLTVTRRIDRIIHESSGELLEMSVPSIVLDETQCSGFHRRFCSRAMLHFWREAWLERAES